MDENTLSYRRIRNDVNIHLTNKEAVTFLALMFYSDYKTGESHVIHKTLRDKTGIPESTLKRYLKQLSEKGFTKPDSYFSGKTPQGNPKRLTDYFTQIPDTCYIMVDRKLLDIQIGDLPLKEQSFIRGFILILKCVCLNFTDTTLYSYRDMEEHMKISYGTIADLMKQCQEYGLVTPNEKGEGYTITKGLFYNGYPPIEMPENEWGKLKEAYTAIYEFCKSKRIICPPYDHKLIGRILGVAGWAEGIKERLEKRMDQFPNNISSLNYFVKIIDGKVLEPEPEQPKIFITLD